MVTLTGIAKKAFDGVAGKVPGVIKAVALTRVVPGAYDASTGSYTAAATLTGVGRGVAESEQAIKTTFPHYVITGTETLWFCAELTLPPKENDTVTIDTREYKIIALRDILKNNELYRLLVI